MYDYNINYINNAAVKSHKTDNYIEEFQQCYDNLHCHGFTAAILRLHNEVSKALIQHIEENNLDFQIASHGNHHVNHADQAIQTFKSYFKSAHVGADPTFSKIVGISFCPRSSSS